MYLRTLTYPEPEPQVSIEAPYSSHVLLFDLDETLVHCCPEGDPITVCIDGEVLSAGIKIRPYALECLRKLAKKYVIGVFTASSQEYADAVIDQALGVEFKVRLYRQHCVLTDEGVYIKDLRTIRDHHKFSSILLVDNSVYSFGPDFLDHGVPILPYTGQANDEELKHLVTYITHLSQLRSGTQVDANR